MNLFTEEKTCDHCGLQPKPRKDKEHLFHGFRDADTGELVCWNCREVHYEKKATGEYENLYSELPEMITNFCGVR